MKTVLVSDLHFGYYGFNKPQFESFLNYLEKESGASRLLILGDIFDLWRADAVDSLSYAWQYLERLRSLKINTHYIIGNHDYHNWISCLALDKKDSFLWMKLSYPWQVFDDSLFVLHGDYFDIYKLRNVIPEKTIYAVYESIYHMEKPIVKGLEECFYNPVMLLMKWTQLFKKKPRSAEAEFIARYLKPLIDFDDKQEIRKLERGLKYLSNNPDVGVQLLVPSYFRPTLQTEMPALLKKPMSKKAKRSLSALDITVPRRSLIATASPLDLARKISGKNSISKVIFGHTHNAQNKAAEGWWNTGCWVDGESTFVEIENGNVQLFRFKDGTKTELHETTP